MQPWIDGWFPRLLLLLVGLNLHLAAGAQNLNPVQEDFRLRVDSFALKGVSRQHPQAPDLEEIKRQLALERARFPDTMTVDQLHQVADALTLFLRGRGFVFHTVYLPPQRVEGGVVEMRVQEGTLGGVQVINQTPWPDQRFSKPFLPLLGDVLYGPQVEERVQALKAQGGFRVFAFYSRGSKSGEAILNLRVDPTDKRAWGLRADNYGSPSSGEQRVVLQYTEYQLTGHHDRLSLAVLRTVDDVANTYGSLTYQLPFGGLDYIWDLSASNNQFEVGDRFAALGLKGDATTLRTGFTWVNRHHPDRRSSWRVGVYEKSNNLEADDISVSDETSRALTLQWSKNLRSASGGSVLNTLFELGRGEYEIEGLSDEEFTKMDLGLLYVQGMGQKRWRSLLQFSARGQYSDTSLPSIEGFSLTGSYGVRGYGPGLFNADSAGLLALEWRLPNLIGGERLRLEPFLFGEYANGRKELISGGKQDADFSGVGLGLNLFWGRRFSAQLVAAKSSSGTIDGVKVADDDQILFEIRLQ
jgi:hemolysin activation/secretion protein